MLQQQIMENAQQGKVKKQTGKKTREAQHRNSIWEVAYWASSIIMEHGQGEKLKTDWKKNEEQDKPITKNWEMYWRN